MDSEEQVTQPETAQVTRSAREGTVTLGLVAAPDIPEKEAEELSDNLTKHIDDRVSWEISAARDPLVGTYKEAPELLPIERRVSVGWYLPVC